MIRPTSDSKRSRIGLMVLAKARKARDRERNIDRRIGVLRPLYDTMQIAAMLGCSEARVWNALDRVREAMRKGEL